jgi:hypothetical protein
MALDLPISDVSTYVEELLDQIGQDCTINGVATKIMISDIQKPFGDVQEKQAVVSHSVVVSQGTIINFSSGLTGIVYSHPTDDMVSFSMKVVVLNATVHRTRVGEPVLDENTGDILTEGVTDSVDILGYAQRVSSMLREAGMGLMQECVVALITPSDVDILMDDNINFKGKDYTVIDVDDITDGIYVIQLATVRRAKAHSSQ